MARESDPDKRPSDPDKRPRVDKPDEPIGDGGSSGGEGEAAPSFDVDILLAMANLLYPIPNPVFEDYFNAAARVCAYVGTPVTPAMRQFTNNNEQNRSNANKCRARYLKKLEEIVTFATMAKSYGFIPPDNPFIELARLNATQRKDQFDDLQISSQLASDLLFNITAYLDLLAAYKAGAIDFNKGILNAAQLSQIRISFDGYGGSGTPSADLMKFLPSGDQLKKKRAQEALAVLDFSSRIPHVLFTLEYVPVQGQSRKGIIIGWRKMSDASGYIINRRRVFEGTEKSFNLNNQGLKNITESLTPYASRFAGTFFPKDKNINLFLDEDVVDDEYYLYRLEAFQLRSESRAVLFASKSTPIILTAAIEFRITDELKKLDPIGFQNMGRETISPWPVFAKNIVGNSDYDWMLAAANIRASITRNDSRDVTRKYSYLGAGSDFLFRQAAQGKLVRPVDMAAVANNIRDSVQKYGASQVIEQILNETGITYYFDGIDTRDDGQFDRAGDTSSVGKIFKTVASAIDPDTALLNIKSLAANMDKLLSSKDQLSKDTRLSDPGPSFPEEISVPDAPVVDDVFAESRMQYVTQIGNMDDPLVDLTTFEGISTMMRVIRIMTDFGPSKT